jgi:acyl-homoserine lactone synthase
MLHIVQSSPRAAGDEVLQGMFAARKSVFVDLLKWDVPVVAGRYEIDQFDDEHAVYLILSDLAGHHLGSARLLPTIRPHILDTLYPELCAEDPPRGPTTYEITRFCLDRRRCARERRQVRDTLVANLAAYALEHGIDHYSAIAELGWYQQILAFGWACRPLGLPRIAGSAMLAALIIDIARDTPARLAARGIVPADLDHLSARAAA